MIITRSATVGQIRIRNGGRLIFKDHGVDAVKDGDGHIKLTDFGLCTGFRWTHDSNFYKESYQANPQASVSSSSKKLNRKNHQRRKEAFSLVGTPNYIAPEVLQVD